MFLSGALLFTAHAAKAYANSYFRAKIAQERFAEAVTTAYEENGVAELLSNPAAAARLWTDAWSYAVDSAQRSILFWETMRQRGERSRPVGKHRGRKITTIAHPTYTSQLVLHATATYPGFDIVTT